MVEVIGVRFNSAGKIYYFDPKGEKLSGGTYVLVETARGIELGHVVGGNKTVDDSEIVQPLRSIIRVATDADHLRVKENKEKEKEAFIIANEKIRDHKLDMKLVDVEYTFDRSKILFYFTADGRVDFRELVKSLASVFHTRIELRQIGVRDEARQLGSYGICGRYLCCGTFLDDFRPVSIKMAKEQGLSLNPTKISGICGRLMCCLQYEQNAYDDMIGKLPTRGTAVETPDGKGVVVDVATLKGAVKVKFDDGDTVRFGSYKLGEFSFGGVKTKAETIDTSSTNDIVDTNAEMPKTENNSDTFKKSEKSSEEKFDNQSQSSGENQGKKYDKSKRLRKDKNHRRRNGGKPKENKKFINASSDDPDVQ